MSLRNLMWHQLMCCTVITHAHSSCYCLLLQSLLCKDSETAFLPPPLPPGRDPLMKVISTAISHLPETGRFMTRPAERKIFFFTDTGGRGKEGGKWMALKTQIDQWAGTKAPLRPNYLQIIRLEINWHQRRNVTPFFSCPSVLKSSQGFQCNIWTPLWPSLLENDRKFAEEKRKKKKSSGCRLSPGLWCFGKHLHCLWDVTKTRMVLGVPGLSGGQITSSVGNTSLICLSKPRWLFEWNQYTLTSKWINAGSTPCVRCELHHVIHVILC